MTAPMKRTTAKGFNFAAKVVPTTPRIIMVIRVSGNRQDVARQRADQKKLEAKFGAIIVRTLELQGVSGTDTLTNEQMQRVLDELASPDIDGIGLSALDRLLRPALEFGQTAMLDRFTHAGKLIWSVREGVVDTSTREGKSKCWQAMGQASAEWHEILGRSMDQRLLNLDAGMLDHGMACYGMLNIQTPDGRKLVIDPAMTNVEGISKRNVVEMVYGWRRTGWTIAKITHALNAKGILSNGYWGKKDPETGKAVWVPPGLWVPRVIRQMLVNSTYCGEHQRIGRIIPCGAIIEKEFWLEVQRVNQNAPERTNGRPPKRKYLLSHFLFDKAGHRMCSNGTAGSRGARYPVYGCKHYEDSRTHTGPCRLRRVGVHLIEPVAFDAVWETITVPATFIESATAFYKAREVNTGVTKRLEKEAQNLQASIGGLQHMISEGAGDPVKATADILAKQKRLREVQADLKEAGKVVSIPSERQAEAALRRIADPKNKPVKFEHRRSILESIQDFKAVYADGEVTITGAIPMPLPEPGAGSRHTSNNCEGGVHAPHTCLTAIPFEIKRRIA